MNRATRITARAIVLGALVSGLLALANPHTHYVAATWSIGWGSLPMGVVFALFLLVAANGLLARLPGKTAFTRGELLAVYGAAIISYPLIRMYLPYLAGMLSYAFYRASPENEWENLIWPHIPSWSRLSSPDAVNWFWQGLSRGQTVPWSDWAGPMLAWGLFTAAAMAAMFCLAALMSRDWIDRQRLTFPLVEVPLALVGDGPTPTPGRSILRNRVFWIGFAVPSLISLLHWLSRIFPAVPDPTLEYLVGRHLAGMGLPWSVLGEMRIRLYFAVIGIACLIPGEVSLSIWLFYVLYCAALVVLAGFGITESASSVAGFNPRSVVGFAEAGGFAVLAATALWQSRGRLKSAVNGLLGGRAAGPDPSAPLSGRAALLGFLAANAFMLWWALRAGMSWWSFAMWAVLFYVVLIGCSRLVAAAGVMRADAAAAVYPFPREVILRTVGALPIGPPSLTIMTYLSFAYTGNVENSAMPQMMNSFKLVRSERLAGTAFTRAAVVVSLVVLVVGSVGLLQVAYRHGASSLQCWPLTGAATCTFRQLDSSLHSPELPSNWLRGAIAGGAGFMLLLVWLSSRFVWWPVSPVGFVIASAFFTNYGLWFNTFIGWLLVTLVRRYGGLTVYRALRPAFLGLVLGEFLTRSALAVFSLLIGLEVPDPFALA
jgi:hypothetical protein